MINTLSMLYERLNKCDILIFFILSTNFFTTHICSFGSPSSESFTSYLCLNGFNSFTFNLKVLSSSANKDAFKITLFFVLSILNDKWVSCETTVLS